MWERLPYMLLEDVFCMLRMRERLNASLTCRDWYEVFYSPRIWKHFHVSERTFTYKRFNFFKEYQREISHKRVQKCLVAIGHLIREITVHPIEDYYNMSGFLKVLSTFLVFFEEYPMPLLDAFTYTFHCENRVGDDVIVIGTGGEILEEIKTLLGSMQNLRRLSLSQLLLDVRDVTGLLESLTNGCKDSLEEMELINCTKVPYALTKVCLFPNLEKLILSPQHLNEEVLLMLAGTGLPQLVIAQNEYTNEAAPVLREVWREVRSLAPHLRVRLECRGKCTQEIQLQEKAPVYEILYHTSYAKISAFTIFSIVEMYKKTLEVYGHKGLPRKHGLRSFHDRGDTSLVLLVRNCPHLHTLVITERVSTCTLLIIVKEAKRLKKLHVRKNAILKRFDWPKADDWSEEFYQWLKTCSRSFELMENAISEMFGYKWYPLSDRVFKQLKVLD